MNSGKSILETLNAGAEKYTERAMRTQAEVIVAIRAISFTSLKITTEFSHEDEESSVLQISV